MATTASAQSPRVVVAVSGGIQAARGALSDRFAFESNVESATVDVEYPATFATLVDASLGLRVWRHVGAGLAVSHATATGAADVSGRIPHPLLFEQSRVLTGSQGGLERAETAVHLQLLYSIEASPTIALVLSAGPTVMRLSQDLVTDVTYDETYPFDEVTFRGATAKRTTATATGFNAGADLRWMFARSLGLGALVRFSRATVALKVDDRIISVHAGGAQAGVGLRVVF